MAQLAEDEAPYGVEVLAFEVGAHNLVDTPDGEAPVHRVRAVLEPLHARLLLVELVADFAHDLLDYVLHGHDPLEGAPLVYDHRHLEPLALELLENVVHAPVLRDYEHLAHEVPGPHIRFETPRLLDRLQDVLDVHHPDDPVRRVTLEEGVAGVVARRRRVLLLLPHVGRECYDVWPRDHDHHGPEARRR